MLAIAALAFATALTTLAPADEALAACAPASPVNNADVTCTGTTTDQNFPSGYGTAADTGNTVTVVPGASVTGTSGGIIFNTGTVLNSGTISGGVNGIAATNAANVSNSGTISGGIFGINSNSANVSNSGTISGVADGILVNNTANVTNSGTISGNEAIIANFNANVINSGTISGGTEGISAANAATVTNSGAISGGLNGVFGVNTADVNNSGTISGGVFGINSANTATVSNSGNISGGNFGINANTVNVTNSGTVSGGVFGIFGNILANVTNSGTITSNQFGVAANRGNLTNSGIISGGTAAIQFSVNSDTLTLLPGSRIIGAINLGAGGDKVNFRTGNQNLTFDTLAGATVTSTVPFVVSGTRVVTIDPTPFAASERSLMDFTRSVSSTLGDRSGDAGPGIAGPALSFAGTSDANARFAGAFADIPGISAYAGDAAIFKNPTVRYSDGTSVWARGFAGERVQPRDGALLHMLDQFYGGMIGGDWQARANLRLGAFVGGGRTHASEELNIGEQNSDLFFGGLFGRYDWGASFLDVVLQGGRSRNDTTRNVNNNLVPGGLEAAKASYDGWYVSPEATYGLRYGLGSWAGAAYILTPSLQVRYLFASFDGYNESGTTAPLTVGARDVRDFEERGQLKLTRTQVFAPTEAVMTSIYGGVLGVERAGSATVDATLLGQAIPFAVPGKSDVWGGFGGAGLEWRTGRVGLFASAEYTAFSDSSSVVSGEGGIRVAF